MRLLVLILLVGCSGAAQTQTPDAPMPRDAAAPDPDALKVAGQYATDVSLERSSCAAITVESRPTTVAHTAGTATVLITHAGLSYAGTVMRDGAFVTDPQLAGSSVEVHRLVLTGRFTTTGFDARVHADVTRNGAALCDYDVKWVGTQQGAPNVIPGL